MEPPFSFEGTKRSLTNLHYGYCYHHHCSWTSFLLCFDVAGF
jgi:hypothetical protein